MHWGENHIFFDDNTFPAFDTLVGLPAHLEYTDENGASQTFTETIGSNTRNVVSLNPGTDGGMSTDVINASRRPGSNNIGSDQNGIMGYQNITLNVDGDVDYVWDSTNQKATISLNDVGWIDGSLPTNAIGTKRKSRWKYSEQHGGRLFVANVVIDPDDANEEYSDMILYSESGMPTMIPIGNYIRVRDPQGGAITGIKSLGDSLAVLMEFGIYRLRVPSVNPSTFSILESNEYVGCIAPRSVVKVQDNIYFCGNTNIFRIDGMFNISKIGSVIEDVYRLEDEKSETIANYDPIKGCVIFRFGQTKHTLYEYNIERDEWNKIVMEKPVSEMGLGITNHIYTIDNTSLTATREDNGHNPAEDSPDDNPDTSDHQALSLADNTIGNYWGAIIGTGDTWVTHIADDPVIAEDFGEEDVMTPPTHAGAQPTLVTYRKFKIWKQVTTLNFRFGNIGDGTSICLPVKNLNNPFSPKYTWFYWKKSVGDPVSNQFFHALKVDPMDGDQLASRSLVTLGLTNADVLLENNGVYFYNGERDIVQAESEGVDGTVPADTFHNPSVIINALRITGRDKWFDNTGDNTAIDYNGGSGVDALKYIVHDESFKILDGSPVNPLYQHGWCVNDAISSNYVFMLPESDNSSMGWISETMVQYFEDNNIDYNASLILGKAFLPVWHNGTTVNTTEPDPTVASAIVWSEIDWQRADVSQNEHFKIGVNQSQVTGYTSGDINSWLNDDSLAFWEKLIVIKANSITSRAYWNPHYPNPFSSADPVNYVVWYDVLKARRFKDMIANNDPSYAGGM